MSDTPPATEPVVENPTYMADIRHFFRPKDVACMAPMGVALDSYEGVKENATDIAFVTSPPDPTMPKDDPEGRWSDARCATFANWIKNKFPMGTVVPVTTVESTTATPPRKDVTALSDDEFNLVKKAFAGLMALPPEDPNSYYAQAGAHGLPKRWCTHILPAFPGWHRYSLSLFEKALRTVPDCSEVTLPYWDITTDLPDRLQHPPFDKYVLPLDPGAAATPPVTGFADYTTERNSVAQIAANLKANGVVDDLRTSLVQSVYGRSNRDGYMNFAVQGHDGGHGSIGPTMAQVLVASYDPVFWFFHCNLDRLWLSWQTRVGGTTLAGFRTTLGGVTAWLDQPLKGYTSVKASETIETDVTYDRLDLPATEGDMENLTGHVAAARNFAFRSSSPVSVRVKDINRMNIPGSFYVKLLADGEQVAQRAFFQPIDPENCDNCAENATTNIDFRLPQEDIVDKTLTVQIDLATPAEGTDAAFPISRAGDPTINARLLVQDY